MTVIAIVTFCPETSLTVAVQLPAFCGTTVKVALGPAVVEGATAAIVIVLEHVSLSVNGPV